MLAFGGFRHTVDFMFVGLRLRLVNLGFDWCSAGFYSAVLCGLWWGWRACVFGYFGLWVCWAVTCGFGSFWRVDII